MTKKLFLGYKLRRLREQKKLSQAALAVLLEVSPSYLNQIENNQRPLTVPVLLRIAKVLDADLANLVEDDESRLVADLREALSDPVFGGGAVAVSELRNAASASPELAKRVLTLYQAFRQLDERLQSLTENLSTATGEGTGDEDRGGHAHFPYEEVRDFFYYCNNYFGSLDEAAERLVASEGFRLGQMYNDLVSYLEGRHGIRVRIAADDEDAGMRAFEPGNGSLALSALLSVPSRCFQLAHQVALLAYHDLIDEVVAGAKLSSDDARSICRVGLANYFAGALVMPYAAFAEQARKMRHDIEQLQSRFGASFEQVCHRLSTLQRPGARGVPFYFVRVDMAGNITKRHSATRFHFTRFGGACPLWNVHEAFAQPGKILVQLARMPDGISYICLARTASKRGGSYLRPDRQFAVGLGCEVGYAGEVVYSAGLDLTHEEAAVPIGVNCRICERDNCRQRAFPPIGSHISVDENNRSFVPYLFS
jgi:predicted transcriptional regulator/transcriptional regulator with XRE-family HTH domain